MEIVTIAVLTLAWVAGGLSAGWWTYHLVSKRILRPSPCDRCGRFLPAWVEPTGHCVCNKCHMELNHPQQAQRWADDDG